MAAAAAAGASCFHPKVVARRSSSKAAIPRPIAIEMATAAGPNRTAGSMARLPVQPLPTTHATNQNTMAIDQHRPAHPNRAFRPSSSGSRAATPNAHVNGESPMGPTENCSRFPHDAAPAVGPATPKTLMAPPPADTTPINHGRQRTPATTVDPSASHSALVAEVSSPRTHDESATATPARTTTKAAAGTKEVRTASSTPNKSRLRRVRCRANHRLPVGTVGSSAVLLRPEPLFALFACTPDRSGPRTGANGAIRVNRKRWPNTHGAPAYTARAPSRPRARAL